MGFVARIFSPPKPSPPPAPVYTPPPAPAPAPAQTGGSGGDSAKDLVRKRRTRTILTSPQGLGELGTGAGKSLLGQ